MLDDEHFDPYGVDWTKCFKCGSDEFEIVGPGVFGRVKLRCSKCGKSFSKPIGDIKKLPNGMIKLLPSRGLKDV
jgi:hypothetical protein